MDDNNMDVTCCQMMYTCCCCASYKLCGRTVHYFKWRKQYDQSTQEQNDQEDCGYHISAWITAPSAVLILLIVYLWSHENTAKFYWTMVIYSDIILCSSVFCVTCVCSCHARRTVIFIAILLVVHTATFLLYLLGVGGAYLIKYNNPWDRTDWFVGFLTILGIVVGLTISILIGVGFYCCIVAACQSLKRNTVERLALENHVAHIDAQNNDDMVIEAPPAQLSEASPTPIVVQITDPDDDTAACPPGGLFEKRIETVVQNQPCPPNSLL